MNFFQPSPLQERINQGISQTWNDINSSFANTHSRIGEGISNFWDKFTGKTSADIAQKNLDLQQQQFDYQRALNEQMMEREDTAYQRAVNDARSAGLSALSVSGGASAGSMSSAPAPQQEDVGSGFMHGLNALQTVNNFINNAKQAVLNQQLTVAQINAQNAQAHYKNVQADHIFNTSEVNQNILSEQLKALMRKGSFDDWSDPFSRALYKIEAIDKINRHNFNQEFGFFNGMSDLEKVLNLKHRGQNVASYPFTSYGFTNTGDTYSLSGLHENIFPGVNHQKGSGSDFAKNLVDSNLIASSEIAPFLDLLIKLVK